MRRTLAALTVLAASTSAGSAQDTPSYVVLASTSPAFSVGALVAEDATIEVPRAATLTLIDAHGTIKEIEGPFLGRLRNEVSEDPDTATFLNELADIVASAETTDVALGLGRTLAPEVKPWLVAFDESLGTDLCVSPDGELAFYRTLATYADLPSVRFAAQDGAAEADVPWAEGDPLLPWPEAVPPRDGASYVIDPGAATSPPVVTLHLAPDSALSEAHMAVWLARSGCALQAEAMVRRLAARD